MPKQHVVLLVYGGTKEKNFRTKMAPFAQAIARYGFSVITFEFRSNLVDRRFEDFGLGDRIDDTHRVLKYMGTACRPTVPISLIGISMGGFIAATLAAEYPERFESLALIAPAAYHPSAVSRQIKFGPEFRKILHIQEGWRETDIFNRLGRVSADTLVIEFGMDSTIPRDIPILYTSSIGSLLQRDERPKSIRVTFPLYAHAGTFTDPHKRDVVVARVIEHLERAHVHHSERPALPTKTLTPTLH
jgi:pimeloyl-ACP methyl ester carboxylesterase